MRKYLIAALAIISLALSLTIVKPEIAQADTCANGFQTAIYTGDDHAWNDYNGVGAGGFVQFYQSITALNSQWCAIYVGTVQADGPFTSGSGMNTRYEGQPIYEFEALNDQSLCIDQSNFKIGNSEGVDDGENQLETCQPGFYDGRQQFVYSKLDYFASIYATDVSYLAYGTGNYNPNNIPELLGDAYGDGKPGGNDGNGYDVFNDYNYQLQFTCTANCA